MQFWELQSTTAWPGLSHQLPAVIELNKESTDSYSVFIYIWTHVASVVRECVSVTQDWDCLNSLLQSCIILPQILNVHHYHHQVTARNASNALRQTARCRKIGVCVEGDLEAILLHIIGRSTQSLDGLTAWFVLVNTFIPSFLYNKIQTYIERFEVVVHTGDR